MIKRFIILMVIAIFVDATWYMSRHVRIVVVHNGNAIIVDNFPLLKSRQIAWWEKNKKITKDKYDISLADKEGCYAIYIQGCGNGSHRDSQLDQDYDLLCFKDIS